MTTAMLGRTSLACGRRDDALEAFRRASELTAPLAAQYPDQSYSEACYVALMVPVVAPAERDSLGARAVGALRLAVAGGYGNADIFAKDTDLDAIRNREDFKQLMTEVETKK
jgi:hypothetical protein